MAQLTTASVELTWADLRGAHPRPGNLGERLATAIALFPCQLLFVHRDAENQPPELRYDEIRAANRTGVHYVCVVPVRMQEAWLLHNEAALREAAGRPSATNDLFLPPRSKWELLPDPKETLRVALFEASGAQGRRARKFRPGRAVHRLAELITDWSPLRHVPSFGRLEADTRLAIEGLGLPLDGPSADSRH